MAEADENIVNGTEPMHTVGRRLRLLDVRTRWFWVLAFYQHLYGYPTFEFLIFDERGTPQRSWCHFWTWENKEEATRG